MQVFDPPPPPRHFTLVMQERHLFSTNDAEFVLEALARECRLDNASVGLGSFAHAPYLGLSAVFIDVNKAPSNPTPSVERNRCTVVAEAARSKPVHWYTPGGVNEWPQSRTVIAQPFTRYTTEVFFTVRHQRLVYTVGKLTHFTTVGSS